MSIQNIKKALFMGVITLFSFKAHAQIEKGATSLGGNAHYDNENPTYRLVLINKNTSIYRLLTDDLSPIK